ncbi:glutaredoxin [Mycobacterium phage Kumao]|uniref:Glutaredoxin n=1 Tax=Mycobacterium phage Kumao TaxID=2041344 RepID=A0A2D1GPY9_9CAUD|nr:glutaredoxin [Mycobacterium phage Kumao]ATN94003.1 glutaredoxin [Mycobacterium phage Kumao]
MSDVSITVFSSGPGCFRCKTVERHLKKRGVPYTEVRVDQDAAQRDRLIAMGYREAPVVVATVDGKEEIRPGYHPDWLDEIAEKIAA